MITLLAEDYNEALIPNPCLHVHFDGTQYYFAETQEDVDIINGMLSPIDPTPEPVVGTALQAVLTATPEELEEIKKILGIT
jgi:hypothetical protein